MIFREFLWISLFQVWNVYVFGVKINPPKISHEMVLESNGNQRVARNEKRPFERAMKWKQKNQRWGSETNMYHERAGIATDTPAKNIYIKITNEIEHKTKKHSILHLNVFKSVL